MFYFWGVETISHLAAATYVNRPQNTYLGAAIKAYIGTLLSTLKVEKKRYKTNLCMKGYEQAILKDI